MGRLITAKDTLTIFNNNEFPYEVKKSIFLAGPIYDKAVKEEEGNWREEAVKILRSLNYDGAIYDPENTTMCDWETQTKWEHRHMNAADVIVFWLPRYKREDYKMSGLISNAEIGLYFNSNKIFIGAPKDSEGNEYFQIICKDKYTWYDNLRELLKNAVEFIGRGAKRVGKEVLIPQHIFKSSQFKNWYKNQLEQGNYLVDFHMEYEFFMPKAKKLFLAIYKPSMYIAKEDRIKENEFVISRTDMSYILAYKPNKDIMNTEIVICEEYRTPVNNSKDFIYELPGGSSISKADELTTASHELEEETGLVIPKNRFKKAQIRQSSATLCSHKIRLFTVELTQEEIDKIKRDKTEHGVIEDTEIIRVHVYKLSQLLKGDLLDWTNLGMILSILTKG